MEKVHMANNNEEIDDAKSAWTWFIKHTQHPPVQTNKNVVDFGFFTLIMISCHRNI